MQQVQLPNEKSSESLTNTILQDQVIKVSRINKKQNLKDNHLRNSLFGSQGSNSISNLCTTKIILFNGSNNIR